MKRKRCISNFFEPHAIGCALSGPVFRPPEPCRKIIHVNPCKTPEWRQWPERCSQPWPGHHCDCRFDRCEKPRLCCVEKRDPCDTWHDVNDPRCCGRHRHGCGCDDCRKHAGCGCGIPAPVPCFFEGVIEGEVCGVCECDAHLFRVVLYRCAQCRFFAVATRRLDECMRFRFDDLRCGEYMVALVCAREPRFVDTCNVEITDCRPCARVRLDA